VRLRLDLPPQLLNHPAQVGPLHQELDFLSNRALRLALLAPVYPLGLAPVYPLGLAPVYSLGLAPVYSLGLAPVYSLGLAPVYSLGLAPVYSLGLALGPGLEPGQPLEAARHRHLGEASGQKPTLEKAP
jgi:hypothetical protein